VSSISGQWFCIGGLAMWSFCYLFLGLISILSWLIIKFMSFHLIG